MNLFPNKDRILQINPSTFESLALDVFHYQYENNSIYQSYVNHIAGSNSSVKHLSDIPFLPIEFFKTHPIQSNPSEPIHIFESSGTTNQERSKHFIFDLDWYHRVSEHAFTREFGTLNNYCILALLPSYLERNNSSLVYMVNHFIATSQYATSSFYLDNFSALQEQLRANETKQIKTLLIGVTFALLDFAETYPMTLKNTIVMETGGMKGRGKERLRTEVHDAIKQSFQLDVVYSEYGMTELLSQAYSKGHGRFSCPPWMRVYINELNDPLSSPIFDQTGRIQLIDLANIDTCSFIQTSDIGRMDKNGQFEVLGRIDQSDLRGCNLMVTDS